MSDSQASAAVVPVSAVVPAIAGRYSSALSGELNGVVVPLEDAKGLCHSRK